MYNSIASYCCCPLERDMALPLNNFRLEASMDYAIKLITTILPESSLEHRLWWTNDNSYFIIGNSNQITMVHVTLHKNFNICYASHKLPVIQKILFLWVIVTYRLQPNYLSANTCILELFVKIIFIYKTLSFTVRRLNISRLTKEV